MKYNFSLRYEARVNAIRASSFIKNVPQISEKAIPYKRNLPRNLSQNRPFFTDQFSMKLASKIPAKFPRIRSFFCANLSLKIPRILTFFPRPTRTPDNNCHRNYTMEQDISTIKMHGSIDHCILLDACHELFCIFKVFMHQGSRKQR